MPVQSMGDMAQQFSSMRNGGSIKSELYRLNQRLSTGKVEDITAHLKGQTARFTGIDHSLARLDGYLHSANETQQTLSSIQTVLQRVDSVRAETSQQLLLITPQSRVAQVDEAARAASGSFESMVAALTTQHADRALLGGRDVVARPLAQAADMLADMQTSIGAFATKEDIVTAVEFWFNDPAGGFATMGYLGDTGGTLQKKVATDKLVEINVRADDPAIKNTLQAAALAALADRMVGLPHEIKAGLLQDSATRLFGASGGMTAIQSRIGFIEEAVERSSVEMGSQKTTLAMLRGEMISADPFETASRLQAVQLQLETHYTVTARMSQLSLLGYI